MKSVVDGVDGVSVDLVDSIGFGLGRVVRCVLLVEENNRLSAICLLDVV